METTIYKINSAKRSLVVIAEVEQDGFISEDYFWVRVTEEKLQGLTVGQTIEVPEKFLKALS